MLPLLLYVITVVIVHGALSPLSYVSREKSGVNQKALNGTFGRMVLDVDGKPARGEGKVLFVASSNRLVQFDYQLNEIEVIEDTPKHEDHTYCYNSRGSQENCYNHYRVLLIGSYKSQQSLLACGTNAYNPMCSWRKLNDLSLLDKPFSGKRICPQDPNYQNVAAFGDGALYTGLDPNVDISGDDALMKLMKYPFMKTMPGNKFLNAPTFVATFQVDKFMYFVFREIAESVPEETVYSRVARVCLYDRPNKLIFTDQFSSFMKARILCEVPGGVDQQPYRYDHIIDVLYHHGSIYPGLQESRLMYAIFSAPRNAPSGSALCVYSFDDSTTTRKYNMQTIFDGPFLYKNTQKMWEVGQPPNPYHCKEDTGPRSARVAQQYYLVQNTLQQSTDKPLLVRNGVRFNALAVDRVQNKNMKHSYDVIFIGTDDGRLLKVVNFQEGLVIVEEILVLQDTGNESGGTMCSSVKGDRKLTLKLDSRMGLLFIGVSNDNAIMTVPVQRCHLHANCKQCLSARDPYCGWCDEQKSCTIQSDCTGKWMQSVETGSIHGCRNFADQPPKITTFPGRNHYFKQRNTSLRFECRATGVPVPTVRWIINHNFITPEKTALYNIRAVFDGGYSRLDLDKLNIHDGGLYECTAENRIGVVKRNTTVLVFATPEIVLHPESKKVVKGGSAIFHCPVVGEPLPSIVWLFKQNEGNYLLPTKRVKGNGNKRLELKTNGSLVLLDVTEVNDGKYLCRAVNDYGRVTSDWATLTVKVPPRMNQLSEDNTTMYITYTQKTVMLHCPVVVPKTHTFPNVLWFHSGRPLALIEKVVNLATASIDRKVIRISLEPNGNGYHQQIQYQQYENGSLLIHPLLNDSGPWECRASNDVGMAVLDPAYNLVIEAAPNEEPDRRFELEMMPVDFHVAIGQPAKFHCSVNSWFKPRYFWYHINKDGRIKRIKQDNGPHYYISRDNSLLIFNTKKEDRGVFLCRVKSKRFPAKPILEAQATLVVQRTVQSRIGPSIIPSSNGVASKSELMCAIVSVEANSSRMSKVRRFASASLKLPVDNIEEARDITCVSQKNSGVGTIAEKMVITPFPRFLEMPAPFLVVFNADYTVKLHCRADCSPHRSYKIVWWINNEEFEESQSKDHLIKTVGKCESWLMVTRKITRKNHQDVDQDVSYQCWFRDQNGGGAFGSEVGAIWYPEFAFGNKNKINYFVVKHSQLTVDCPQLRTSQNNNRAIKWKYYPPNEFRPIENEPLLTETPTGSIRISNVTEEVLNSYLECERETKTTRIYFEEFNHEDYRTETRYIKNSGYNWIWEWQLPD